MVPEPAELLSSYAMALTARKGQDDEIEAWLDVASGLSLMASYHFLMQDARDEEGFYMSLAMVLILDRPGLAMGALEILSKRSENIASILALLEVKAIEAIEQSYTSMGTIKVNPSVLVAKAASSNVLVDANNEVKAILLATVAQQLVVAACEQLQGAEKNRALAASSFASGARHLRSLGGEEVAEIIRDTAKMCRLSQAWPELFSA